MNSFSRAHDVVSRRIAGEIVLVPLDTSAVNARRRVAELYTLNAAGELLWEQMSTPQTEESLNEVLVANYGIAPAQARDDVRAFLRDMMEIGAIESRSEA